MKFVRESSGLCINTELQKSHKETLQTLTDYIINLALMHLRYYSTPVKNFEQSLGQIFEI